MNSMNYNKFMFRSLPVQWLIIILVVVIAGCSNTHSDREIVVDKYFANELKAQVKATSYDDQFIVRLIDGSVWEVKTTVELGVLRADVIYKNCLFDPLYSLPELPKPPPTPPLPLEKPLETTNGPAKSVLN